MESGNRFNYKCQNVVFTDIPFMGMFDWDEDLIPLTQSPGVKLQPKPSSQPIGV